MKPDDRSLKLLAEHTGRPVAELVGGASADYLTQRSGRGRSIFELVPHPSGAQLEPWTREELLDAMLERT
jgi:hypothetical protein